MNDLLKFITCGSVDDGKSTLIGHILYDAKLLYADQEEALILDSKVGSRGGAIDYSLLLDGLMAEREQGITIDVAYRYFTTDQRSFIVADTPGHEEYTRNMAVGASFADLAIILLDATKGVLTQTRRHARICSLMGIRYFVFAVNKMDLAGYSLETFAEIEKQIRALAAELQLKNIRTIPVSATAGDNVTEKSANMDWYTGDPILSYLEHVDIESENTEQGFYLPVQRVCRPNHTFRGFQGQVESGEIHTGDEIKVLPSEEKAVIRDILIGNRQSDTARFGQAVTVTLDREIDVSRGCIITRESDIGIKKAFQATLLWMDDSVLSAGKEYFVKIGTRKITGRVKSILYKTDINTGAQIETAKLRKNEIALCELLLDEEIPVDCFQNHKTLGELILIDRLTNMTSACGVVEVLEETEEYNHAILSGNGYTIKTLLFDEYFYNDKNNAIDNFSNANRRFEIGDTIPLKGESYDYPAYFDILVIKSGTAVEIRDGKVANIIPFSEYRYIGLPAVNDKGFSIEIHSEADKKAFFEDIKVMDRQVLYTKWMRFETYRRIIFTNNYWGL